MSHADLEAHFRTLELPPTASLAEVRRAYRQLSRVWHPDRFVADAELLARAEERQGALNVAYQALLAAYRTGAAPLRTASSHDGGGLRGDPESATSAAPRGDGPVAPRGGDHSGARARLAIVILGLALLALIGVLWRTAGSGPRTVRLDGARLRATGPAAIGPLHGCAAAGGIVRCWGEGPAARAASGEAAAPGTLRFKGTVEMLTAGLDHMCALLDSGELHCWGANYAGQLGDRSLNDRAGPVSPALPAARTVSSLAQHTCVTTTAGAAYCWGSDADGQLGVGRPVAACRVGALRFYCSDRPERVAGETRWRAIAAGGSHTCALTDVGDVRCWGSNRNAQLGAAAEDRCDAAEETTPCARVPAARVPLPARAVQVVAGAAHSCALLRDGRALCWGAVAGIGTPARLTTPRAVIGPPFTYLAAGGAHTCGLTAGGAVFCWGGNADGARGARCAGEDCALRALPILTRGVRHVSAGFGTSCAQLMDGGIRCWGRGEDAHAASAISSRASGRLRTPPLGRTLHRLLIEPLENLR